MPANNGADNMLPKNEKKGHPPNSLILYLQTFTALSSCGLSEQLPTLSGTPCRLPGVWAARAGALALSLLRLPRKFVFDPTEVGIYHCINRCVHRAFLCGIDELTSK